MQSRSIWKSRDCPNCARPLFLRVSEDFWEPPRVRWWSRANRSKKALRTQPVNNANSQLELNYSGKVNKWVSLASSSLYNRISIYRTNMKRPVRKLTTAHILVYDSFPSNDKTRLSSSWPPQMHSPRVRRANQVCESSRFRPSGGPDGVIFCRVHTPSLARSTNADSIMKRAETAAAGWVVASLNSSLLLTPGLGFWVQKATKLEGDTHYTRVWRLLLISWH